MQIPRVFRTSSFRLTVLYGALASTGYLLLFGVVFLSTTHYMQQQIDASVAGELAEIQAAVPGGGTERLRDVVTDLIGRSPDYFYLLQDSGGRVLAGNLPATTPLTGVRQWPGPRHRRDPFGGIRGRGITVAEGAFLFVGLSTVQLHEVEALAFHAFLWGLGLALLLSLAAGAAMSLSVLGRIESVSRTAREIMGGDLSRRIPARGTADEFDHLAASLNAMLDRIQTLMEGLRQVSNDIAHDLRTPLTRLRQRLELSQHGSAEHVPSPVIPETLRDIDSILETFGALLRIAQVETGARKAGFAPVDLEAILRDVIEIYQPALEERGQALAVHIEPPLATVGDRELLTQLFANLLDNASRHSPPKARIGIAAALRDDQVRVQVTDDGRGIPAEFREKVLQRFFRLETSRSTPGSGLGLSLAVAIAKLHGADLELSSNAPGLKVTVRLGNHG